MPGILHTFFVNAPAAAVFKNVSTETGLNAWWSKTAQVNPALHGEYTLDFGPGYIWKALATIFEEDKAFELQMTEAQEDWLHTKVGFVLNAKAANKTEVKFYHTGWPEINDHFTISSYCWAMYLRILKRYTEFGEVVPYEKRLSV